MGGGLSSQGSLVAGYTVCMTHWCIQYGKHGVYDTLGNYQSMGSVWCTQYGKHGIGTYDTLGDYQSRLLAINTP